MIEVVGGLLTLLAFGVGPIILLCFAAKKILRLGQLRIWVAALGAAVFMIASTVVIGEGVRTGVIPSFGSSSSLPAILFFGTGLMGAAAATIIDLRVHRRTPRTAGGIIPRSSRQARSRIQIFLSYRRADSADIAGRIYDHLTSHFGEGRVFKDVDSIPLGVDFRKYLLDSIGQCELVLLLIGQRWIRGGSNDGSINDPADFVRIEIEAAIQQSVPIIPVMVQGARMPRSSELPDSIRALVYQNAIEVRPDPDFSADVARLIRGINAHLR